jgi:hypothetical protein
MNNSKYLTLILLALFFITSCNSNYHDELLKNVLGVENVNYTTKNIF